MLASPLELLDYRILSLHLESLFPDDDSAVERSRFPSPADLDAKISQDVNVENESLRRVEVELTLSPAARSHAYYDFSIKMIGLFSIDLNCHQTDPNLDPDRLVATNAPSLLYSAARELLLILTSRGPHPAMLLPTVRFLPEAPRTSPPPSIVSPQSPEKPKAPRKARVAKKG